MKLPGGDTFLFRSVMLKRSTRELLSQNTVGSDARRQLLEMAQEDQGDTSQQTTASDEDKGTVNQASTCVIEIHDSTNECEEEPRHSPVQMEEKAFIARLHSFMKAKGTPIERIPHLGFKQINLWMIYKAVEKLGGYDSVTAGRYWKKVYDELGGSPGSTSAATCTRRHYERLVLPFERHMKGEEDKPLPPSKPRKPYKRNLDGKVNKAEVKRKRIQPERELDSEMLTHRSPEAACQGDAGMRPHSSRWASSSDRHRPDCPQPSRAPTDLCPSVFAHLLPVPASGAWTAHIPSAAGEVISPLEKKKRMAQASLNLPLSPHSEDKERPSVIHCPQSPARASSSNGNSSDGSPLPLSSSSSRSPSSSSISSEDSSAENEEKPTSASEPPHGASSTVRNTPGGSEDSQAASLRGPEPKDPAGPKPKDPAGPSKDGSHISSQPLTTDSRKSPIKDHAWKPSHKASSKYSPHPVHLSPSFTEKLDWAASTSSFTKVIPKSVQLLRPAPVRPAYRTYQGRVLPQDDSLPCAKELNSVVSLFYPTDKRDKSRTMLQKVPLSQQSLPHGTGSTSLPGPCVLSGYDKSGRDSRHHPPLHPAYLPGRMRPTPSQLLYRHVPLAPAHPALIGPVYPYPYHIPLLAPQTGYACTLPAIYPHKM